MFIVVIFNIFGKFTMANRGEFTLLCKITERKGKSG